MVRQWPEIGPIMPVKTSYTKGYFEVDDISGVVGRFINTRIVFSHLARSDEAVSSAERKI